jgi:hypothetical protein
VCCNGLACTQFNVRKESLVSRDKTAFDQA